MGQDVDSDRVREEMKSLMFMEESRKKMKEEEMVQFWKWFGSFENGKDERYGSKKGIFIDSIGV